MDVDVAGQSADEGGTSMELHRTELFGQDVAYRLGGPDGAPVVLLVHGLGGSSAEWGPALALLARDVRLPAPDLPGHGESSKGRGDYSLGAFANGLRDLLDHLDIDSATLVGHSLGGGVAMQFTYQYPDRVRELALVSAGGLGPQVTPLLRVATVPGAFLALRLLGSRAVCALGRGLIRAAPVLPGLKPVEVEQVVHGLAAFSSAEARAAFIATTRGLIDWRGQRVDATNRLHLTRGRPLLLIHGDRDTFIPLQHSRNAHAQEPASRLEVFERSGHYPQLDDPPRFAQLISAHARRGAVDPFRPTPVG